MSPLTDWDSPHPMFTIVPERGYLTDTAHLKQQCPTCNRPSFTSLPELSPAKKTNSPVSPSAISGTNLLQPRLTRTPRHLIDRICIRACLTEFASELAKQCTNKTHLSAWGKLHTSQQISQVFFFFFFFCFVFLLLFFFFVLFLFFCFFVFFFFWFFFAQN